MAKIKIDNLFAVKNFEMEIKQFNLIIGEQATGKSTICKAIYFFKNIRNIVLNYLYGYATFDNDHEEFPKACNAAVKDMFIRLFGYSWEMNADLKMRYEYNQRSYINIHLKTGDKDKRYISVNYSKYMVDRIKELEGVARDFINDRKDLMEINFFSSEKRNLHEYLLKELHDIFNDVENVYYIPAGRSLLTLMTNQKTNLDYSSIDLVNRRFMQFIENIQPYFKNGVSNVHKYFPVDNRKFDVNAVCYNIVRNIKGEYFYASNHEFLKVMGTNERVLINYASSGQQEVLWLFNQLYVLMVQNQRAFIVIEEPEAHLYPLLQKKVMEFIVQFMNITGSTVLVTTHSPYILTSVNTMYYGGYLAEHVSRKEVEKILGKSNYIETSKTNAFKLTYTPQQTCFENLVDNNINELATELIDEVSQETSEEYTNLVYLEEKKNGYAN